MNKSRICVALMLVLALVAFASVGMAQEYSATAKGFGGDVTVTLDIEDGAIVAASAVGESETDGIGSKAIEQMPAAMAEQNSVTVDTVSRRDHHQQRRARGGCRCAGRGGPCAGGP